MNNDIIIGVDLAKTAFQLHGSTMSGEVVFRKKLNRTQFAQFMAAHVPCLVAMEACGTSHYWARELTAYGHEVRLVPPTYVKPFVKRQKNDAADAEAIVTAATRPGMSFVPHKSAETQATTMMIRTRDQLIEQRTATVNALRGHLSEFGVIAPVGLKNVELLRQQVIEAVNLPELAVDMAMLYLSRIDTLTRDIDELTDTIRQRCSNNTTAKRMQTMPGIGPIGAATIMAFAPDLTNFKSGRDFAAWLGLIPKQHSTGGKTRLGQTTKMGQRDIRQALIIGAMSTIAGSRRSKRDPFPWLKDKLDRKPRMVAAIALANKMARQLWAMVTRQESYQPSHAAC